MKILKKISVVFLCITIIFSLESPAFAEFDETSFIVVSGMNTFPLYNENNEKLFPLSTNKILKLVDKIIVPISNFILTNNYEIICKEVLPVVYDAFEPISCKNDGDSLYNVHTDIFDGSMVKNAHFFENKTKDEEGIVNAAIEKFGAENVYFFNYDWRLDPLEHADELNSFIKNIKNTNPNNKIVLSSFSMGGTVLCSYLYKYGSNDIDTLMLCSTAFQGTSCVGDLFNGNVELSLTGLINRLAQLTRNNFFEDLICCINNALNKSGFNNNIEKYVNNIVINCKDEIYNNLLIPIFGYMPGLWGLINYDNYEQAKLFMLNKADDKLLSRIDEYNSKVQCNAKKLLEDASYNTQIYIIAQYNMQGLPVSSVSTSSNNDYLIDCCYASGGANCSLLGETLGDDYKQKIVDGHNHLSPDNQIDASTCMFPEYTWFISDMGHVDYPQGSGSDIIMYFANADKQLTVNNSKYSQFLKYSYNDMLVALENESKMTLSDRIFIFLNFLIDKIFDYVNIIKKLI